MKPDWLDKSTIYKVVTGSNLYGYATADSDVDIRGVCVPPYNVRENPFNKFEQWEDSESDTTIWALDKFTRMCANTNPNVIELLFAPQDKVINQWGLFAAYTECRHLFLSKKAATSFQGYARGQMADVQKSVHKKQGTTSKRAALIEAFGYDTKAAAHVVRLCFEGVELLMTGNITFPLNCAKSLYEIRSGNISYSEFLELASVCYDMLKQAEEKSTLPEQADTTAITDLYFYALDVFEG